MKSQIGEIVSRLFKDKYSRNALYMLDSKKRMNLQRELSNLINAPEDKCDLEFCNAENSNVSIPVPYEEEYKFN